MIKNMPNILFVNRGNLGGPSNSLIKLLMYVNQKYNVKVLLSDQGELTNILEQIGIPYSVYHVRYRSIPRLYCMLIHDNIDLVYANSFNATAWRVLIAAKLAGIKFIWHIREIMAINARNSYSLRRRIRYADQIIAVSEACQKSIISIAPHTPVTVVYNGINLADYQYNSTQAKKYVLEQFGLSFQQKVIVSIGTITERKNQYDIIKAIHKIIWENPNIHLFLFGYANPDYLSVVWSLIESLNLQDNVHIPGYRHDIKQILCGADLLIHTAIVDPHPRAVLDALGAGLPVIAYDVDGVSETLIDGENGFLIPVGNIEKLENRIRQLIFDPVLRYRFSQNGRQTIENHFTDIQTASKVVQVIDNILTNKVTI